MKHQPWEEALDIDDDDDGEDLPSLLRPCKRQQHDFTISQSNPPTQTLESYSQSQQQSFPSSSPPPPTTTSPRRIPGPAGAVQAAMNKRMSYKNQKTTPSSDFIPTQEYLRRVIENGDEHDDDFTSNAWTCAVEFVLINGLGDGVALGMPLSTIKNGLKTFRVPQVVAMIKSCSPNGLGDMIVTLKDPSGTIGGSIHRKVLLEEEFGRNISVGAVLILQKVVVFSPSRTAHYLNITLRNMVKVISKDSGPPSKQNLSALAVKHSASVCVERPGMPQKACSLLRGRIEGILDGVRVSADVRGTAQNGMHMRNNNGAPISSHFSHVNQIAAVEGGKFMVRQDLVKGIAEETVREHTNNNGLGVQLGKEPDQWKQADEGFEKQSQPSSLRTNLPQWTDEQLDELFAMDSD